MDLLRTTCVGEPINVIISAKSDPRVLTDWGFRRYSKYVPKTLPWPSLSSTHLIRTVDHFRFCFPRSLGYSFECLNMHRGGAQKADLGKSKPPN